MTALTGFLMIAVMIIALVKFKTLPITVFATLPVIAAFLLGFGPVEVFTMTAKGIISVLPTAALFVGSITYFGIMSDAGLFERPVSFLMKKLKPNLFSVLALAIMIGMISHLDGSGTTTIMITVPAMLPIAKKLNMRIYPLALVITETIAVMNFLPWGGPLGRAATVVGSDAVTLWHRILPVQVFGILLLFAGAWILAKQEEKAGYGIKNIQLETTGEAKQSDLARPSLFWFNLILTILIIVLLFIGCPAFLPFLIGIGIALPVNYGKDGNRAQEARIKDHAKDVVPMIITIIGAGMFLGVLNDGGIIEAMANVIISIIPAALGGILHVIMGLLAMPLSLVFEADTMIFGIVPIVAEICANYGIPAMKTALTMSIGHNVAVGLCMTNATVYFALGLFGLEYGETLKYSFLKVLVFGSILILFSVIVL